jgi:hypothetical protein
VFIECLAHGNHAKCKRAKTGAIGCLWQGCPRCANLASVNACPLLRFGSDPGGAGVGVRPISAPTRWPWLLRCAPPLILPLPHSPVPRRCYFFTRPAALFQGSFSPSLVCVFLPPTLVILAAGAALPALNRPTCCDCAAGQPNPAPPAVTAPAARAFLRYTRLVCIASADSRSLALKTQTPSSVVQVRAEQAVLRNSALPR